MKSENSHNSHKTILPVLSGGNAGAGTKRRGPRIDIWRKCLIVGVIAVSLLAGLMVMNAAAQSVQWQNNYGAGNDEAGYCAQPTGDGGYILAGDFKASDKEQAFMVKTNAAGTQLWFKTYGDITDATGARYVVQTSDGGYILAGYKKTSDGSDAYVVRTNANGNILWSKTYNIDKKTIATCIQQTKDGGFVLAGSCINSMGDRFNMFAVKITSTGALQWTKYYSMVSYPGRVFQGSAIQQTTDGGYILVGNASVDSGNYAYLVKAGANGNKAWEKLLSVTGLSNCYGLDVQQTKDGGYIVTGEADDGDRGGVCLIKINTNGVKSWVKIYQVSDNPAGWFEGNSVRQTSDGGYIIAGFAYIPDQQVYLIRTNSAGTELWERTYGGRNLNSANSVRQTKDGGYIIGGFSRSFGNGLQAYLLKISPYDSSAVSNTIPGSMKRLVTYYLQVTMKNTGDKPWTYASKVTLSACNADATTLGMASVGIPSGTTVKPGQSYTFKIKLKAPNLVKGYTPQFRMKEPVDGWFGATVSKYVKAY